MSPVKTSVTLPRSVSLLRVVAQGLVAETAAANPTAAVQYQLAVQGQLLRSALTAIVARTNSADLNAVRAAFDRGELVRSWALRNTLHITTARDHHWLRVALRERQNIVRGAFDDDTKLLDQAANITCALFDEYDALSRQQLLGSWAEQGVVPNTTPPHEARGTRRALIRRLHADGLLVNGPLSANEPLFIDARPLPSATTGPSQAGSGMPVRPCDPAALAEIARRYATSHGPVSAADFARWAGLPKTIARQALQAAVDMSSDTEAFDGTDMVPLQRLTSTQLCHLAQSLLGAKDLGSSTSDDFFLRTDLADLLSRCLHQAQRTLFLPSFDELHNGYRNRSCLADKAGETLLCPASNGMFRPMIIDRGQLVAVLSDRALLWADGQPASKRLSRHAQQIIDRLDQPTP